MTLALSVAAYGGKDANDAPPTVGGNTFRPLTIGNSNQNETHYVTHMTASSEDGSSRYGVYLDITINNRTVSFDDPAIQEMFSSLVLYPEAHTE